MKSNQSKISDNFHWFELKDKFCSGCKLNFYSFNNFETLDLDIAGTFTYFNSAPISLMNCLNYQNQKKQKIFCEKCKKYTEFQIKTKIYSSPINFIFTLNRGYPDQMQNLFNIKFIVEEKIDIGQFLENKKAYTKFELIGIVSYYPNEKKYVCFGKSSGKPFSCLNGMFFKQLLYENTIFLCIICSYSSWFSNSSLVA